MVVHYERCHGVIREAIADMPQSGAVIVLGSGLLRTSRWKRWLPGSEQSSSSILFISRLSGAVSLPIPAQHENPLRDARSHWRHRQSYSRQALPSLLSDPLAALRAVPGLALVISAMCLSQLPRAVLRLAPGRMSAEELESIGKAVVERHLSGLQAFACRQILLTDTAFTEIAANGALLGQHDLLHGVVLPPR